MSNVLKTLMRYSTVQELEQLQAQIAEELEQRKPPVELEYCREEHNHLEYKCFAPPGWMQP